MVTEPETPPHQAAPHPVSETTPPHRPPHTARARPAPPRLSWAAKATPTHAHHADWSPRPKKYPELPTHEKAAPGARTHPPYPHQTPQRNRYQPDLTHTFQACSGPTSGQRDARAKEAGTPDDTTHHAAVPHSSPNNAHTTKRSLSPVRTSHRPSDH